jgi:oligopeptidase A
MTNPLLAFEHHPDFAAVKPEHVGPAVAHCLAQCRETIARIEASSKVSWLTVVQPLLDAEELLDRAFSVVGHLNNVVSSPELRDAHDAVLPDLANYSTEVAQNRRLFALYQAVKDQCWADLTAAQQRLLTQLLRDFELGGAKLEGAARERFAAISTEQATLSADFSNKVLDVMNAWHLLLDSREALAGVPEDDIESMKQADGRYKVTLHMPSYLPVMQYAHSSELRGQVYKAYNTRASEQGDPAADNSATIEKTLQLRLEAAQLLGYRHHADVSLVSKMAPSSEAVVAFLTDLGLRAKPYAERDLAELKAFAKAELGLNELQVWDYAYVSEKLKQARYSFSEQAVKQYFQEDKVLEGLFRLMQQLYGITLEQIPRETWHPSVRYYAVREQSGSLVGHFLLDLHARENKRNGAWVDVAITRRGLPEAALQTPLVYVTCNNAAPVNGKPALLTHDDVITLFHEFGHALHGLLCREEQLGVTGFDGVEWDAIELPSQFMENFCWEWDCLQGLTQHVETGASLPRDLYDKMIAAKNFQAGMQTVRQIEFALADMRVHSSFDPNAPEIMPRLQAMLEATRAEFAVVIPPAWHRGFHAFSHIFAGGYAAGYYSYKWSEVLSADAYAAFEGEPLQLRTNGERFRNEILARGGSRSAAQNFAAFRGRDPDIQSLLRHNGMLSSPPA